MGFGLRFRERLDEGTADEIDKLLKFLKQFLLLQHNEDGSHIIDAVTSNIASADAAYVTLGNTSDLTTERALVGTSDEIDVTDNGANSTVAIGLVASPTVTGLTVSGLTSGRVVVAGASGVLGGDADLTFATDTLTATKVSTTQLTDSGLTSGRVVVAGTAGILQDDADLTFSADTLTVTKLSAPTYITTPIQYLGSSAGSGTATSATKIIKKVTGISDNVATDIFTVTIPNANHAAAIKVTLLSSNGGTDAFESSRVANGAIVVARTTGVNAVAVAAALDDAGIATVAGGATHTLAYNVSAITGAVDASNSFTIQVTIDDSGNLGSNQIITTAELLNSEATGISIS